MPTVTFIEAETAKADFRVVKGQRLTQCHKSAQ